MSKVDCLNCQRLHKQLSVQKADYQFEIKKIQQDKSTEKAMYEIHLQKELRRWQENFHKEQSFREDQARNWLSKHDATVSSYQTKIASLTEQHASILKTQISQLKQASDHKYRTTVENYENKISALQSSHKEMTQKMSKQYSQQLSCLKRKNEQLVQNLKASHKAILDEKVKRYEGKILGIESQKKKECELHQKTKKQATDMQAKLYQQIFGYKKNIIELENKIQTQKKQIYDKKTTIEGLQEKIITLKQLNEREMMELKTKHKQQLQEAKENYKNKVKVVYEDALKYCNQYQESITRIDETRNSEKQQYMINLEEIQQSMENRISRPEDLEQIETLRLNLTKKIKECDMINEELRWYRLELQNKQETYNKIFVPMNGSNNQNIIGKRKQFKLRRQGRSVTTVREILQSINSGNLQKKNTPIIPKPKVL